MSIHIMSDGSFPVNADGVPLAMDGDDYWIECCEGDYDCVMTKYNERRSVLNVGNVDCHTPAEIRDWISTSVGSFVDLVNGPLTADKQGPLMLTLETWQAQAGIDIDNPEPGDLIKGLDALEETVAYGGYSGETHVGLWFSDNLRKATKQSFCNTALGDDCAEDKECAVAFTRHDGEWLSETWNAQIYPALYQINATIYFYDSRRTRVAANREKSGITISPTHLWSGSTGSPLDGSGDIYCFVRGTTTFSDLESLGYAEDTFVQVESFDVVGGSGSDVSTGVIEIGNSTVDPVSLTSKSCPPPATIVGMSIGYEPVASSFFAIMSWDFTEC